MLNDFEAVGYGVPELTEADLFVLHDVPARPKVRGAARRAAQLGFVTCCIPVCGAGHAY